MRFFNKWRFYHHRKLSTFFLISTYMVTDEKQIVMNIKCCFKLL